MSPSKELVEKLYNARQMLLTARLTQMHFKPLEEIAKFMDANRSGISGYFDLNPFFIKDLETTNLTYKGYVQYYNYLVITAQNYLV